LQDIVKTKTKATELVSKKNNNNNQIQKIETNEGSNNGTAWPNFIKNIEQQSKETAETYNKRIRSFASFVMEKYEYNLDVLIDNLQKNQNVSPYQVLSGYVVYLNQKGTVSPLTIKQRVNTARNFMEFCDIEISDRKFRQKVKSPRIIMKDKEALTKQDIVEILNTCADIRLKTYVHLLAATGMRAGEALSIRLCDLDLDADLSTIFIRGKYTKTKRDRTVFLTQEVSKQIKSWLEYKYRRRRRVYYDRTTGKAKWEYMTPVKNPENLIFSSWHGSTSSSIDSLHTHLGYAFGRMLDRIDGRMREREDSNVANGRRRITLHSFRRFVKTTISDLGYSDYSEFFIGHNGSTYYRKSGKEQADLFKKIEPHLTFLDISALERRGADTQTKIEELEAINQTLRQKDSMKEDTIATLSDTISTLSDKVTQLTQEMELVKKRQTNMTA